MNELPDAFWQGVEEFNAGEYYACHDTLEALWLEATEPERTFYQGILQLAVGLYHYHNQNVRGAVLLLGEGCRRLTPYDDHVAGIDLGDLRLQAQAGLAQLQKNDCPQRITAPVIRRVES